MTDADRDELLLRMSGKLDSIVEDVSEVRDVMFGDGGEDKPGLRLQVDRLNQRMSFITWIGGTVAGAALAAFAELVWRKVTGKP